MSTFSVNFFAKPKSSCIALRIPALVSSRRITIDQRGVLALYNRINNIQKLERATTLAEVKDIVDEAIENAEGGGIKKAFGSIFSKKYNENDYLILHEKDFE